MEVFASRANSHCVFTAVCMPVGVLASVSQGLRKNTLV